MMKQTSAKANDYPRSVHERSLQPQNSNPVGPTQPTLKTITEEDPVAVLHAGVGNAVIERKTVAHESNLPPGFRELHSMYGNAAVVQAVGSTEGALKQAVTSEKAEDIPQNHTGMPDPLKTGLEQLSGMDLSGVRVHKNSSRPAQLNALAYTHGQDIHVGPGQEKHLPHEGWHAVQQMQGRVQATMQAKGVSINDDEKLEREADVMGAKALQMKRTEQATTGSTHPGSMSLGREVETKGESSSPGEPIAASKGKVRSNSLSSNLNTYKSKNLFPHEPTQLKQQGHQLKKVKRKKNSLKNTRNAIKAQEIFWTDLKTSKEPGAKEFTDDITGSSYDANQRDMVKSINPKTRLEIRLNERFLKEKDVTVRMQAIDTVIQNSKQGRDAKTRLAKIAAAKQSIIGTFKVKSVVDGDTNWTEAELIMLKDALSMLPAVDKAVLEGIEIKRVTSLGGTTAGRFIYKLEDTNPGDTAVTHSAVMELADRAYRGSNTAETKRTIIHEVGHAIAGEKLHNANIAHGEAGIAQNQKAADTTDSFDRLTAANTNLQAAIDAYNAKKDNYNQEKDPARKATLKQEKNQLYSDYKSKKAGSKKLLKENKADAAAEKKAARATSTSKKAAADTLKISAAQLAAIKTSADKAKTTHDSNLSAAKIAARAINKNEAAVQSYHNAVLKVSIDLETFYTETKGQAKSKDNVEALIDDVNKGIKDRDNTKSILVSGKKGGSMIAAFANLETAQTSLFEAAKKHALAKNRTKKVHEFATFVERNSIAPITPYAADNWPHKPEEFYAEAYSFWVSGRLKAVSAVLNNWFDNGKYR